MKRKEVYKGEVTDAVSFPGKAKVVVYDAPEAEDNGSCVTVKNVIPGQKIEFRLKRQGRGELVRVLEKSPHEIQEVCTVFGECGGCTYSSMDYDAQLEMKLAMVKELFAQSGANVTDIERIFASPLTKAYRNKMEYAFGDMEKGGELTLGLHKRGSRHDVLNVFDCLLVHDDINIITRAAREFFEGKKVPYYHKTSGEGYLRHLVLRRSEATGEILVNLVTTSETVSEKSLLETFVKKICSLTIKGNIAGVIHTVNNSLADVVKAEKTTLLYGSACITEELLGLKFRITPFSFFQTNSKGAEVLYSKVREYAIAGDDSTEAVMSHLHRDTECGEGPVIFDLYSGTGTIAQIMAPVAKKVYGVEIVEEAVEAARENAGLNGLDNCEFIAGDVLKCLDEIEELPDFIILDPPRDGVHPKALEKILGYGVDNILYISCKPTSLVRDMEKCREAGYGVKKACCVDMFPGTGHVETVCLLVRGNQC